MMDIEIQGNPAKRQRRTDEEADSYTDHLAARINFQAIEWNAYLKSPSRRRHAGQPELTDRTNEAENTAIQLKKAFCQAVQEMQQTAAHLLNSHEHQAQAIKAHPPATASFWRGALAGGSAGYLVSFFAAKALTLAFVQVGEQARWAFAPLAGVLHATLGEAVGGGLRSTFATYQSPDGALWANLISAMSDYALYTVGGRTRGRAKARHAMQEAVTHIQRSLDARLGPDPNRSQTIALFGAWWRSLVCDELAFLAFAVAYTGTGALQPVLRRMVDTRLSRGVDFGSTLVCGLLGASFTGALQNWMRQHLQRAAFITGSNHNAERVARQGLLTETIKALQHERARIEHCSQKFLDLFTSDETNEAVIGQRRAIQAEAQRAIQSIDSKLDEFAKELLKCETNERIGATSQAIIATGKALFCGPADPKTPWLGGGAKLRRALAKSIANTAAVATYLYYLNEVANTLHPLAPTTVVNQTADYPAMTTTSPPAALMEHVDFALHGFVLIGAWCARTIVSNATELVALSAVPGLGLRIASATQMLWGCAHAGHVPETDATQNHAAPSDDDELSSSSPLNAQDEESRSNLDGGSANTQNNEHGSRAREDDGTSSESESAHQSAGEMIADAGDVVFDLTEIGKALGSPYDNEASNHADN